MLQIELLNDVTSLQLYRGTNDERALSHGRQSRSKGSAFLTKALLAQGHIDGAVSPKFPALEQGPVTDAFNGRLRRHPKGAGPGRLPLLHLRPGPPLGEDAPGVAQTVWRNFGETPPPI